MNSESIKARLKNQSLKKGHILQEEITIYGLERTIYRISISDYMEKFTLKGEYFCMHYLRAILLEPLQILTY